VFCSVKYFGNHSCVEHACYNGWTDDPNIVVLFDSYDDCRMAYFKFLLQFQNLITVNKC
jgi:hypothetical protein